MDFISCTIFLITKNDREVIACQKGWGVQMVNYGKILKKKGLNPMGPFLPFRAVHSLIPLKDCRCSPSLS